MLAVFLYKDFYLHLTLHWDYFIPFIVLIWSFIFYSGLLRRLCGIGLAGGINNVSFVYSLWRLRGQGCVFVCLLLCMLLFIFTCLSDPDVKWPLKQALRTPPPTPWNLVPPLEFLSCQHCTLTFNGFLWESLSTPLLKWLQFFLPKKVLEILLLSWASSQMYVVPSKHNYALSIKAIQVVWVCFF